ncbi:hypothetical protein FKP32DRAFT_1196662 [Trametes sanguinea]|nr:hypothetical protein FKP32DRAFT_1196662 [Trametes sanguinea]
MTSVMDSGDQEMVQALAGGEVPLFFTFQGGVPADQVSAFPSNLPFGYHTFSVAAEATSGAGSSSDLVVRNDRDAFELPSQSSPTGGVASGDQWGEASMEDAFAPGPSNCRGTKRSRDESEEELTEAGPSTSEDERPSVRRRCSASPPRCTRETCLSLNLHLLDGDAGAHRSDDDDDDWSNVAQASDTEPEHPEVEEATVRLCGTASRIARPRRHPRRRREDSEEPGSPSMRSKKGL